MYDEVSTGARLRALRRWRGMTLVELGGLAALSPSFLSMVERGQRALDRRSHISALATALRVSQTDLVRGPHLGGKDSLQSGPHLCVPAIRKALTSAELGESAVDRARPVDDLATLVAGPVHEARRVIDWKTLLAVLPDVLEELHFHVAAPADERVLKTALQTLLVAAQAAAGILSLLGYVDLSYIAAARAAEAAARLEDPTARGKAMFQFVRPTNGNWAQAARRAEAETARLAQDAVDGEAMQVLGMLHLNASLVSAANLDPTSARSHLGQAADLARYVPDDLTTNWQSFSATNVGIWRAMVELELGESGGKMLELARAVDSTLLGSYPARQVNLLMAVGRGLARERKTQEEAVQWLRKAETVGPQQVRNHALVRDTVAVLLEKVRTVAIGRELRGMAARMGIPH